MKPRMTDSDLDAIDRVFPAEAPIPEGAFTVQQLMAKRGWGRTKARRALEEAVKAGRLVSVCRNTTLYYYEPRSGKGGPK